MNEDEVRSSTIFLVKHGSVAYGTNTPTSDVDEKGVAVPRGREYYYGPKTFEQKDSGWEDGHDRCIYDLRKFISLAKDCNPNIVEVLYVDKADRIKVTNVGDALLGMRSMFLSQKAAKTFVGYAVAQLHRIHGHHKWLNSPPKEPVESDFTKTHYLSRAETPWKRKFSGHEIHIDSETENYVTIKHIDHEAFDAAKKDWKNYQDWKAKRNPARATIEAKYGYDTKHAYHLVRLLRMGSEILRDGSVVVKRPDKDELLDIRHGKYTYQELLVMAEDLKADVDRTLISSPLPKEVDMEEINKKQMDIIDICINHPNWAYQELPEWVNW